MGGGTGVGAFRDSTGIRTLCMEKAGCFFRTVMTGLPRRHGKRIDQGGQKERTPCEYTQQQRGGQSHMGQKIWYATVT